MTYFVKKILFLAIAFTTSFLVIQKIKNNRSIEFVIQGPPEEKISSQHFLEEIGMNLFFQYDFIKNSSDKLDNSSVLQSPLKNILLFHKKKKEKTIEENISNIVNKIKGNDLHKDILSLHYFYPEPNLFIFKIKTANKERSLLSLKKITPFVFTIDSKIKMLIQEIDYSPNILILILTLISFFILNLTTALYQELLKK
ncbi:MAG: hypothetical protein KBD63_00995 [Bacteriovoracaceae bacterium]|nr:hypothetical protein [Bacteriovoracaceae bacterium]